MIKLLLRSFSVIDLQSWQVCGLYFIKNLALGVIIYMPLYLTQVKHQSAFMVGLLFSIYGFGNVLGAYWVGRIVQEHNNNHLMIYNMIINLVILAIFIVYHSIFFIVCLLFMLGAISSAFRVNCNLLLLKTQEDRSNHINAYSLFRIASTLGYSFSAILCGYITVQRFDWIISVDMILTALGLIFTVVFFKKNTFLKVEAKTVEQTEQTNSSHSFLLISFFALIILVNFVFFQRDALYPVYLFTHYHVSNQEYGLLSTVNIVVMVLFKLPIIEHLKKYNQYVVLGISGLVLSLGFGILPLGYGKWLVIISYTFISLGMMITFSNIWDIFRKLVIDKPNKGYYYGIYHSIISAVMTLAPLLGGVVYQQIGPNVLWNFSLFLGVIFFIVCLWLAISKSKSG